jgi:hypothetical protein
MRVGPGRRSGLEDGRTTVSGTPECFRQDGRHGRLRSPAVKAVVAPITSSSVTKRQGSYELIEGTNLPGERHPPVRRIQ